MNIHFKHFYKVYGLNIDSNIKIEEFPIRKENSNDKRRVTMIYGKIPSHIKVEIEQGARSYVDKKEIWFHIDNVATYWITNGNTVIIEPSSSCDINLMKIYIMGSVLGFILIQREEVAIHGGSIIVNGKAIILTGERGAGKSTLTMALGEKGYPFLTDDIAAVTFNEHILIEPGFPYHKLCLDVLEKMNYVKEDYMSFEVDRKIKYIVSDFDRFSTKGGSLAFIFEITKGNISDVIVEELKGGEKLKSIIRNIYRIEYIQSMGGVAPDYLKKCIQVAKNTKFYRIIRPLNEYTVENQIQIIEEMIKKDSKDKVI
jgi:hypothetical protein